MRAKRGTFAFGQKFIENAKNGQFWRLFEDSVTRQVTFKNTKNGK